MGEESCAETRADRMPIRFTLGCDSGRGASHSADRMRLSQGRLLPAGAFVSVRGTVLGGQQPVSGSSIELYAAGTSGNGSAALPLLSNPVRSDSNGNFSISAFYPCPSASSQVYVVARGGNPGLPSGTDNPALALTAMLGPCSSLSSSTRITINEVTTVGSVWSLRSLHEVTHEYRVGSSRNVLSECRVQHQRTGRHGSRQFARTRSACRLRRADGEVV